MTGQRFDRLVVVERVANAPSGGNAQYLCLCDCGQQVVVTGSNLRNRHTASCGCLRREKAAYNGLDAAVTHGHTLNREESLTYRTWKNMRQRCSNPNSPKYKHYGGAGITICERWLHSFENFLADMGERPVGTSIHRFGDEGNYEPGNCCWLDEQENRHPLKRTNDGSEIRAVVGV